MFGGDRDSASGPAGSPSEDATERPARKWSYPSAEDHPDEEIFIHRKWCKSCGICYSMCPKGVITADKAGRPVVARPGDCIVCGLCEILCPDMAITVHKKRQGRGAESAPAGEGGNDG